MKLVIYFLFSINFVVVCCFNFQFSIFNNKVISGSHAIVRLTFVHLNLVWAQIKLLLLLLLRLEGLDWGASQSYDSRQVDDFGACKGRNWGIGHDRVATFSDVLSSAEARSLDRGGESETGVGRRSCIHRQGSTKETSVEPGIIFWYVITVGPSTCTYSSTQVAQQSKCEVLPVLEKRVYSFIPKPKKYH